jgi:hypothetical protein
VILLILCRFCRRYASSRSNDEALQIVRNTGWDGISLQFVVSHKY